VSASSYTLSMSESSKRSDLSFLSDIVVLSFSFFMSIASTGRFRTVWMSMVRMNTEMKAFLVHIFFGFVGRHLFFFRDDLARQRWATSFASSKHLSFKSKHFFFKLKFTWQKNYQSLKCWWINIYIYGYDV